MSYLATLRVIFWAIFIASISLFIVKRTFAVSLSISNVPSTVDQAQLFGVDVSLSCSGCSDSYLRGVFYPSGTSYFGYTQDNSGNLSNAPGSSCTSFFKVAQSDLNVGTWSGTLKVKLDTNSSYYTGPGEYLFKVGRYVSSCSSPTWSSETTIAVTGPTPTPTSSPTNTPAPTSTPTPTPTKMPTPTVLPSSSASASAGLSSSASTSSSILGISSQSGQKSVEKADISGTEVAGVESKRKNFGVFMGIGAVLLGACAILLFRQIKN